MDEWVDNDDDAFDEYCPVCNLITDHKYVEDEVFDTAIECQVCKTVWEADDEEV